MPIIARRYVRRPEPGSKRGIPIGLIHAEYYPDRELVYVAWSICKTRPLSTFNMVDANFKPVKPPKTWDDFSYEKSNMIVNARLKAILNGEEGIGRYAFKIEDLESELESGKEAFGNSERFFLLSEAYNRVLKHIQRAKTRLNTQTV